jgi:hypothetical protein
LDTHVPVASSKIAFGYLIVVHASRDAGDRGLDGWVQAHGDRHCRAAGDRGVDGVAAVVGRVHPHQHRGAFAQQAAGLLHGVTDQAFRAAR